MLNFLVANIDSIVTLIGIVMAAVLSLPWVQTKLAEAKAKASEWHLDSALSMAYGVVAKIEADFVAVCKANGTWNEKTKSEALSKATLDLMTAIKADGLNVATAAIPGLIENALIRLGMSTGPRPE